MGAETPCGRPATHQAALDFLKVPYQSVEVDPLTRSQIKFSKEKMRGGTEDEIYRDICFQMSQVQVSSHFDLRNASVKVRALRYFVQP